MTVEEALIAVAEAEANMAKAELRLREAWATRLAAFAEHGWAIHFVHENRHEAPYQRVVVENPAGKIVDLDKLTAQASAARKET